MPRSSNVYVVCLKGNGQPVAAFTVKYELEEWLEGKHLPTLYHVWRFRDGKGNTGATNLNVNVHENDNQVTKGDNNA